MSDLGPFPKGWKLKSAAMTPPREPQTAAGRRLDAALEEADGPNPDVTRAILAIEAEAAGAPFRDLEAMRIEKGWPTPNAMRSAAEGLDHISIPKYGDILRWVADRCDEPAATLAPAPLECPNCAANREHRARLTARAAAAEDTP